MIKGAVIGAAAVLVAGVIGATAGIAELVDGNRTDTDVLPPASTSSTTDPFLDDPELKQFASRYLASSLDCARPHPDAYKREIGRAAPNEQEGNVSVRCYSNSRWAVYFIKFVNSDERWFLYDELRRLREYTGDCEGWGPGQDQTSPPQGQEAQKKLCFAANYEDGLGIYWEPAKDGAYEHKYAGVLLTRGIDDGALKEVWEEHARIR